jgi:site-specific DNA-methyltransferase (cytosine-N4-specific)
MLEGLPRVGGKHKDLVDGFSSASSGTNIGQKRSVGNGYWRNRRSVWRVATASFHGAHFAAFPRKLVEPCVLAGSRPGDTILEPFMGSGTEVVTVFRAVV